MEETVIWEQHTVTLHRVSDLDLFFFIIPLSSFVFFKHTSARLYCPEDVLRVCVCVFSIFCILSLFICPSGPRTLREPAAAAAGCAAVKQ